MADHVAQVGMGIAFIGWVWTLVTLFKKDGATMGIIALIFTPVCLYAPLRHIHDRRGPSWTLLLGVAIFAFAFTMER